VIVWDLGDVLAAFRPERRTTALCEATGLDPAVVARIWSTGLDGAVERGELSEEAAWTAYLDLLEDRIGRDDLRRCWAEAFVPAPDVLAVVDEVGGGALLTDNGPVVEAMLAHELAEIGRRLDPWLLSWRLGSRKASPEAFARAGDLLDGPLTLVDDKPDNVAAARAAGWSAVLHVSADATRAELIG
jgi:FMN phosphatase YigB (HAD superfamily)